MGEEKKKKRQKKERTEQKNPQLNKKEICLNVKGGKKTPHRCWETWTNVAEYTNEMSLGAKS